MSKSERGFSVLSGLLIVVVIGVVAGVGWYIWQKNNDKTPQPSNTTTTQHHMDEPSSSAQNFTFANPKKGAHFESSTPAHTSVLAAAPPEVVLDFNFDLAANSTISITKDDKEYGTGSATVDANKLALRRKMDTKAPDGVYTVTYNGCWPDRSCHDGSFQFAIDSTLLKSYDDKRGQKMVTINLSDLKFKPMNLRISKDTTVTWVNDDSVEHYVNTDSHPAHSHTPGLNSKALAKGATYRFTFTNAGAYPYHCSAHAANMQGMIVVE